MSIHVYLKNEVCKDVRFLNNSQAGMSKPGGSFLTGSAMGAIDLQANKTGRLYFEIDGGDTIPPVLVQYIDEISIWGNIPNEPHREYGVYKTELARAEVEGYSNYHESIKVTSKTLVGALELVEEIKAGTIRPYKSYEATQGGKSRQQLEDEFIDTQQQLGDAWAKKEEFQTELRAKEQALGEVRSKNYEFEIENRRIRRENVDLAEKQRILEEGFSKLRKLFEADGEKINLLRQYANELFDSIWPITLKPMVTAKIGSIIGQFASTHPPVED